MKYISILKQLPFYSKTFLSIGMLLNIVFIPAGILIAWGIFSSLTNMGTEQLRIHKLSSEISNLNETLSMYARLAATTGQQKWEQHYRQIEPKLDEAIHEIALSSRDHYQQNYVAQTKAAYSKLIELETLGFSLVRHNRLSEAAAVLFGEEYEKQKDLYSQGLRKLTSSVQNAILQEVENSRRKIYYASGIGILSIFFLLCSWTTAFLIVKKHLKDRDIVERALATEKERLDITLRSVADGVISTNLNGKINLLNKVAEELTGWPAKDALGNDLDMVVKTKPAEQSQKTRSSTNSKILIRRDGSERIVEISFAPILDDRGLSSGNVLVFRDVTEKQKTDQELVKKEKLESLGLLAGGIAHDFNNILTVILGYLGLIKLDRSLNNVLSERITQAEKAVLRAKSLTQQLLSFSKGGMPIKTTASLAELLPEWVKFPLRGSNVICSFKIDPDLFSVEIDEGQINHVIHNLIINADQAMPDGGKIIVKAQNYLHFNANNCLEPGKYVKISIQDSGPGISPEYRDRIFEPYFTTKIRGNGLGLSTSYATIKRHGGILTVDSAYGHGAVFSIYLPASQKSAYRKEAKFQDILKGRGRILLMDDEPVIRDLCSELLEELGYKVHLAENGEQAVSIYQEIQSQSKAFDAVIMDLTIPGAMGGKEAIQKIRELDPDVVAIVSSGYCHDPVMGNYESYGFQAVLPKPYSFEQVSEVLRSLLLSEVQD